MPKDLDEYLLFQDSENNMPHIPKYETDSNAKKYFKSMWYDQ